VKKAVSKPVARARGRRTCFLDHRALSLGQRCSNRMTYDDRSSRPNASPASTSVGQWRPKYTLLKPVSTAREAQAT